MQILVSQAFNGCATLKCLDWDLLHLFYEIVKLGGATAAEYNNLHTNSVNLIVGESLEELGIIARSIAVACVCLDLNERFCFFFFYIHVYIFTADRVPLIQPM